MKITHIGHRLLQKKLAELDKQLQTTVNAIGTARQHGDTSENAELAAAKQKQQQLNSEMKRINEALRYVRYTPKTNEQVDFGTKITLEMYNTEKDIKKFKTYVITNHFETDLIKDSINVDSPIIKQLINKRVGTSITINKMQYTVTEISIFTDQEECHSY